MLSGKFMYIYDAIASSIKNDNLLQRLDIAASAVADRLQAVDFNSLVVSDYTKKYIRGYLQSTQSVLQIYTYLIYVALKSTNYLNLEESVFVDYGGGTGIMSLLAKEMGFGTILYVDIYDISCNDAEIIAISAGGGADRYICGGVDELFDYVKDAGILVDIVTSYDVIEHIYDLNNFYAKMNMLNSKELCIVCASSANMYNPMIRKKRTTGHQKVEYLVRRYEWGCKERDSRQSYFGLRREIISKVAPQFPQDVVDLIAKNTRGLYKSDIEKCVNEYVEFGDFAYRPDHPTNTCDPLTGNWNERLMYISVLKDIIEQNKFEFSILSGLYGYSKCISKRYLKFLINKLIVLLGKNALFFSPYYIVKAQKK